MTPTARQSTVAAILVAAFTLAPVAAAPGKGQSARAPLGEVRAAAQAWQQEAVPTNVFSQSSAADGSAPEWSYQFFSASGSQAQMPAPMTQMMVGQRTKAPEVFWMVGTGVTPGEACVLVDARTGKLFQNEDVK